jgi:4-hydroxybenzoate polyprenyltransferase
MSASSTQIDPSAPNGPGVRPGNTSGAGVLGSLKLAASDIKLHHSVFALPFAVLGAVMAWDRSVPGSSVQRFAGQMALVVACMVFARTWAMMVNRLADARYDAMNPRTARRAIASGQLSVPAALGITVASALLFITGAAAFWFFFENPWPTYLCLPVLGWLALYSFAKRFTALCHVLLGSALAISPLAAALAVNPAALTSVWSLYALCIMITCWVAGFDVIYALQDEDFDRGIALHSIPAKLGSRGAALLARTLHVIAAGALIAVGLIDPRLNAIYFAAAGFACACLVLEHVILARSGLKGLPLVFFTLNGVISCVVGGVGTVEILLN